MRYKLYRIKTKSLEHEMYDTVHARYKVLYTQTIKLCWLDVYVCQFHMYERNSFKFSPYKLWSFRKDLHLRVIHLIISRAADKAANMSTLKIKSQDQ